jgi:hypothetical protein
MASTGRRKAPVRVKTTGKKQLGRVADYSCIELTSEQGEAVRPLDPPGFASACAQAT